MMSGSKSMLVNPDFFNFEKYKGSLSSTQQLDAFLDQYEEKYGLQDQNLKADNELGETDSGAWRLANRIKRRNESYRMVHKLLKELQIKYKQSKGQDILTKRPSTGEFTSSGSSEYCWANEDDPPRFNRKCDNGDAMDRPQAKFSKEEAGGNNKSKSVLVAKKATRPRTVVKDKSELSKTHLPMENPPFLPSLQKLWPVPSRIPIRTKSHHQNAGVIGQNIPEIDHDFEAHGGIGSDVPSYDTDDDNDKETAAELLGNWFNHSKTMIMKLLSIPEPEKERLQKMGKDHFTKNKKQEFRIGSVLGEPYISGLRYLPKPTFTKPTYKTQNGLRTLI